MRFLALAAVLALLGSAAHAQTPTAVDVATVSMTPAGVSRLVTNTICATDGRDLVCDGGAQLLPNGVISTTGLTVNGVAITGSGGAASPTNVPAFRAHRNGINQTVTANAFTKIQFTTEDFDTTSNFDIPTSRFQPNVPGNYLLISSVSCNHSNSGYCLANIYKNGSRIAVNGSNSVPNPSDYIVASSVLTYMNGTTDFAEAYVYINDTLLNGTAITTFFSGSLLASGNGLISGSTALGDRITSGTTSGVVAMAGGTVSFTTGGTSGTAYLDTVGRFVGAGVSTTGAISATSIYSGASLQLASPTAVTACTSTAAGTIRYNSPTTTLELCTGSGWQPMGVGIPAGTISAFASTTCPTGWSEYTAARGRFLRGIDNGAGNDPSGTRAPGSTQADLLASHSHASSLPTLSYPSLGNPDAAGYTTVSSIGAFSQPTSSAGGAETRPRNVAVTYCQFNGTSNGWNNPLSGGSTVAAGSTGQLQYNTGNSFDASAGLTWTNSASLLTVTGQISATNISVTALTVNGVAITGGGGVSRLASMTDVTTTGVVSGSVLAFNAATSSWTALPIQQVMSTTTIVSGWPDALQCTLGGQADTTVFYLTYAPHSNGRYYYRAMIAAVSGGNEVALEIAFTNTGSYQSFYASSPSYTSAGNCAAKSISTLYAEGKGFNFIGAANASGSTALGDRITSGTASGVVAMAGGTVSFTTGGTSGTAYLDTVGRFIGPGVSATGTVSSSKVATNDVKLSQVGGECSTPDDYGRFFRNPTTGRFQLCMPRP